MERRPTPQDITWFLDLDKNSQLNLDPPYQRKSVWTRRDKEYFIDTIFNNYPCPAVFLHKETDEIGSTKYHVVDGKQRLSTILEFAKDKFAIPRTFSDTRYSGKKFSALDTEGKKKFWNYMLTVEQLPYVDTATVNSIFERINRNARKLTEQEMRHARFDGWFITRVEAEAEKQEWRDFGVVTTARAKRMADVQFISEIVMMTIKREISGFDHEKLDDIYADYENPSETVPTFSEEQFDEEFERIKKSLTEMFDANEDVGRHCRALSNFYSLWSYVLLDRKAETSNADLANAYATFVQRVVAIVDGGVASNPLPDADQEQAAVQYARYFRGAATDATPRLERHKALVAGLNG